MMDAFRDAVDGYLFRDLGYVGDPFTWEWGMLGERLGRTLEDSDWMSLFLYVQVLHLPQYKLDYNPLNINSKPQ